MFRGKNKGKSVRGAQIDFGEYALKAQTSGLLSAVQIEAARKAISHFTKREGKIWIRIFPHTSVTAKASGSGMGAGKGDVKGFIAKVTAGKILFELAGVGEAVAKEALARAGSKLPIRTNFLKKEER